MNRTALIAPPRMRPVVAVRPRTATADRQRRTPAGDRAAARGLAGVYLLLAYEWLVSGCNKLVDAGFRAGLADELRAAASDNPRGWYARILTGVVLPHAGAFALLAEWGEVLVGLGLVAGAVRWLAADRLSVGWDRLLGATAVLSLLGGGIMAANYYLMSGGGFPWIDASRAFDASVDLDLLLAAVSVALLGAQVGALRRGRRPA